MKKLIAILFIVVLSVCSLVGCRNQADNKSVYEGTTVSTYDEVTETVYVQNTSSVYVTSETTETSSVNITTPVTTNTKVESTKTESGDKEVVDNNGYADDNEPNEETVVSQGNATSEHTHSYAAATFKATCTKDGYSLYSCHCGASYESDYTEALGHSWGEWETVKEATTESEGKKQRTCDRCGKVESKAIDKVASPYDARYYTDTDLLAERILYYINQYRSVDASSLNRMTEYADYRAVQLSDNFAHDANDIKSAATTLKYGEHVVRKETYYDPNSGEVKYTGNTLDFYESRHTMEAITKITNCGGSIDEVAKRVADTCYGSSGHWSYVGSSDNIYVSIGVYIDTPNLYVCIIAGDSNAIDYE